MENKKINIIDTKRIIFLAAFVTVLLGTSCQKEFDQIQKEFDQIDLPEDSSIQDLDISSDFNWETFRDIELTLTGYTNGIVEVASTKGDVYQRAYLKKYQPYSMKLTIPTYMESIRLLYMEKDININIQSNNIEYGFIKQLYN